MSKNRKKIPENTEAEIVFLSSFKCCVCQDGQKGHHIHHIDSHPENNDIDNLALLCFEHHDEATKIQSLSKKLSPKAIKKFRDSWYQQIEKSRKNIIKELDQPLIGNITQEDLVISSINANIIIELLKAKRTFFHANWKERTNLISQFDVYEDYISTQTKYKILIFLQYIAVFTRAKMTDNAACAIYSLVDILCTNIPNNIVQFSNEAIIIADNIIYDAVIHLNDMAVASQGCKILKIIYQLAKKYNSQEVKDKVLSSHSSLKNGFLQRDSNYDLGIEVLELFENNLENFPIYPEIPRKLIRHILPLTI